MGRFGTKGRSQRAAAAFCLPAQTCLPTVAIAAMLVGSSLLVGAQFLEGPRRIDTWVEPPPPKRWDPMRRERPRTRELHVDTRPDDTVVLRWRDDGEEDRSITLGKREVIVQEGNTRRVTYPELGPALADEWKNHGLYTDPVDVRKQRLVLLFANDAPVSAVVGLLDAIGSVTRPSPSGGPPEGVFEVSLSAR